MKIELGCGCGVESLSCCARATRCGGGGGVGLQTATPADPLGEEKGAGGVEVVEGLAMALLYLLPVTLATCSSA